MGAHYKKNINKNTGDVIMTEIKKTNRDKGMKLVQIIEDGKDGAVHRVHVTANAFAVVTQKGGDSRLRTIKF